MLKQLLRLCTVTIVSLLLISANAADIKCAVNPEEYHKTVDFKISKRQSVISTAYDDVYLVIDDNDRYIGQTIRKRGTSQPNDIRTFGRFIKEGDTVLNLGAHYALESIIFAKAAGPKGKLIIFQPYSISYNILLKSIYLNKLNKRTTTYKVAVSNQKNSGYIIIYFDNTSGSRVYTKDTFLLANPDYDEAEPIQINSVDNVLPENTIVDFALIDVERLQIPCLQGMKKLIQRSPNLTIVIEWSGFSIGKNAKDYDVTARGILNWLQKRNYTFHMIERENYIVQPFNCKDEKFKKLSIDEVFEVSKILELKFMTIDLFLVPNHIQPNQVF